MPMTDSLLPAVGLELPACVTAFSTERGAGVTPDDPYSRFNACHYVGDDPEHVAVSRGLLSAVTGIPSEQTALPRQTHSDRVAVVDALPVDSGELEGVDGLVTVLPDVALCVNTADCVPVVLVDAAAHVLGVAHCGWRGIVNSLLPNMIDEMVRLGANPSEMDVAMGPAIGTECFEVGEEVAAQFRDAFPDCDGIVVEGLSERPHVDLGAAVRERLVALGVGRGRVKEPRFCTRCQPERFFSARALGIGSGRVLTCAWLPLMAEGHG